MYKPFSWFLLYSRSHRKAFWPGNCIRIRTEKRNPFWNPQGIKIASPPPPWVNDRLSFTSLPIAYFYRKKKKVIVWIWYYNTFLRNAELYSAYTLNKTVYMYINIYKLYIYSLFVCFVYGNVELCLSPVFWKIALHEEIPHPLFSGKGLSKTKRKKSFPRCRGRDQLLPT